VLYKMSCRGCSERECWVLLKSSVHHPFLEHPFFFHQKNRELSSLERELSRELELPWIKDRSRGAESGQGALDAVLVVFGNRADEVRCEVDGKNFVHIWPVEQIESVHRQLQPVAFADVDHARKADIHGTKAIATVGIARRETDSVGHRVAIVIGVESDEDCERPRRLHGDDTAEFEVSQE